MKQVERQPRGWRRGLAVLGMVVVHAVLGSAARVCDAHPTLTATALVRVKSDGRVDVLLRPDIIAFALNDTPRRIADEPMNRLLDGPPAELGAALAAARERFATGFELRADGRRVGIEIDEFPGVAGVEAWKRSGVQPRLPVKLDVRAHGALAAGVKAFTVRFPEVMGEVIVTVDRPGMEPVGLPLNAGEASPELEVTTSEGAKGAPESMTGLQVAGRYLVLGFTHIVPEGYDHVLFVLGLFLLSTNLKSLLWQVTAFTVAHSITLVLAVLNVIHLSPGVIEPLIAASITFVAVENLCTTKLHVWRPLIVFVFGLVHGAGFASALSELGLPRGQLAAALVSFNAGVEAGQLAVIAGAFALVGVWRKRPWYRKAVVVPGSVAIACVGAWWTLQRLMGW